MFLLKSNILMDISKVVLIDLRQKIEKMDFAELYTTMGLFLKELTKMDTEMDGEDILTQMEMLKHKNFINSEISKINIKSYIYIII